MPRGSTPTFQPGDTELPREFLNTTSRLIRGARSAGVRGRFATRPLDPGVLIAENASGADREQYHILGVAAFGIAPEDNEEGFKNQAVLSLATPNENTHQQAFGVLQEPIADGACGRVLFAGVTQVKIDVTDEAHTHAAIKDGDATQLQSASGGPVVILYKESGTGTKWAVVRFGGGGCPPANEVQLIHVFGNPTGGTLEVLLDIDGTEEELSFSYDDEADDIKTELETHSEAAEDDFTVEGDLPNEVIRVTFVNNLGNKSIRLMRAKWNNLTGGVGLGVVVTTDVQGHA